MGNFTERSYNIYLSLEYNVHKEQIYRHRPLMNQVQIESEIAIDLEKNRCRRRLILAEKKILRR